MITIVLPVPPSTNNLFATVGRKRIKSQRYRDWEIEADDWFRQQPCEKLAGAYTVEIALPEMMRGDIDNRIKPLIDFLTPPRKVGGSGKGVIPDDKHLWRVSVERNPNVPPGECHVRARSVEEEAA